MKRLIIFLCVANVVSIGLWVTLFLYARNMAGALQEHYIALAEETDKEAYATSISRDLRDTKEIRDQIERFIIRAGEEAFFLEKIESLAGPAGVSVRILSFEKKGDKLHLSIESQGTFATNYHFLSLLETIPYQVKISKSLFTREETSDGNWKGRYELDLLSYLDNPKK